MFNWRDTLAAYLFLLPFLLVYGVFLVYPLIRGFWVSLHDWDLLIGQLAFVDFSNYVRMVQNDPVFWEATWHTVEFVLYSTPLLVIIGLLLAMALNRDLPGMTFFRTVFFSSYVLSISVITLIWFMLLNPTRGLIGAVMEQVGLEPVAFLTNSAWAMPAIVITTVWWTAGFNIILFLAGLQDIPRAIYEAAELDGAGAFTKFFRITIPLLRRTILLVIILQIIASFQVFGQVFLMTGGGPNGRTRVLVQHIYETGFRGFELGYASAMSMFLFIVMLAVSLGQIIINNRDDNIDQGMK
jgi:multiple sugar transport system permease protein